MRAENKLYTLLNRLEQYPRLHPVTYMKAGVYRISSCCRRLSTIDVIIPAAWKAIVRDGYAILAPGSSCVEVLVAGGICARWSKHSVVLELVRDGQHDEKCMLTSNSNAVAQTRNGA